ncbi:unnamed protein product [Adineta steineri]|uniref:G-protein coupled receptors family 1 profile domain-containing protein n=1 Tax=Adineta steineri TaxID=433720 RepID=A0A814NLW7_9BILA|nr:unnamed protein product [Adineta steineri]
MSTAILNTIGSEFTIYAGSFLFLLGFSGNLITIYLFRTTRHTPITFILIILSIVNCISLIVGLLNRVLVAIVGIDPILLSPIWCKLRVYLGQTTVLICQSCACLASINCFLSTCRLIRWRRLVSLSISRQCIFILVIFWILHGLFNPCLTKLITATGKSSTCSLTNLIASNYTAFFLRPVLVGIFPICILSVFGLLTHRNLQQLRHKRRFEQQPICKMLLLQMIAYVLGTLPYASFYAYQSITSAIRIKSTIELAQESLVLNFINIIFYMPQSSPFYIYYLSSKTFRKQIKDFLICYQQHNRIQPLVRTINEKH